MQRPSSLNYETSAKPRRPEPREPLLVPKPLICDPRADFFLEDLATQPPWAPSMLRQAGRARAHGEQVIAVTARPIMDIVSEVWRMLPIDTSLTGDPVRNQPQTRQICHGGFAVFVHPFGVQREACHAMHMLDGALLVLGVCYENHKKETCRHCRPSPHHKSTREGAALVLAPQLAPR